MGEGSAGISHDDHPHGNLASRDVYLHDNLCVEEGIPERVHGVFPCGNPCVEAGSAGIDHGAPRDGEEEGIPFLRDTPHVGVDTAGIFQHDYLRDNSGVSEAFLHCNLELLEVCLPGRWEVLEGHIQVL